jgi:hypothetical protein
VKFDANRPSDELFDLFQRWLWYTWFGMVAMAALAIAFAHFFPAAPLGLDLAVLGGLAVAPATMLVVALRILVAADRARSREAADMPGWRGVVERHGLSLGLVAVGAIVALTVIVSLLTGH